MRFLYLILIALVAVPAAAQIEVVPDDVGTIGIGSSGATNYSGQLTATNSYVAPQVPYGRALLHFSTSSLPSDFDTCRLEMWALGGGSYSLPIDATVIPSNSTGWSQHFDVNFHQPYFFCEGVGSIVPGSLVTWDLSDCMKQALAEGMTDIVIRLSVPLVSSSTTANFASTYEYRPPDERPEPKLVFENAVPAESQSLGGVKSMFR